VNFFRNVPLVPPGPLTGPSVEKSPPSLAPAPKSEKPSNRPETRVVTGPLAPQNRVERAVGYSFPQTGGRVNAAHYYNRSLGGLGRKGRWK
jgi:hypothetical protein